MRSAPPAAPSPRRSGGTIGGLPPPQGQFFQAPENPSPRPLSSPTPRRYVSLTGVAKCKTIRAHRAPPGREPLAPTGRLRAVARPRSRRRRVRLDPAPRPCPCSWRWTTLGPAPRPCPWRRTTRGPVPRPCPCRTCRVTSCVTRHGPARACRSPRFPGRPGCAGCARWSCTASLPLPAPAFPTRPPPGSRPPPPIRERPPSRCRPAPYPPPRARAPGGTAARVPRPAPPTERFFRSGAINRAQVLVIPAEACPVPRYGTGIHVPPLRRRDERPRRRGRL